MKLVLFLLSASVSLTAQSFVEIRGKHFYRDGKPYYFMGANFWCGMNLASAGPGGDRERLRRELDQLQALCVTNLRIMAGSEGPDGAPWRISPSLQPAPGEYNEALLKGLDFLLCEIGRRGMTAVLCLNNFWPWTGGFAQYHQWYSGENIPYPPPAEGGSWFTYARFSSRFYRNEAAMAAFDRHLRKIVGRVNSFTGIAYRDDPAIMAWQLANEPRGMFRPRAFRRWIRRAATLIKSIDPNHLLSIGSEGNTAGPTGNHFRKDHASDLVDYTTIHIWVQNWGWYDPKRPEATYGQAVEKARKYIQKHLAGADKLDKPLVLEEFGMARDLDDHHPEASATWRDRYYREIFQLMYELAASGTAVAGCNFWAWSGEGRPREPKAVWQAGDPFTGDPPHEYQGWYSVYDRDIATLQVIREFGERMTGVERRWFNGN